MSLIKTKKRSKPKDEIIEELEKPEPVNYLTGKDFDAKMTNLFTFLEGQHNKLLSIIGEIKPPEAKKEVAEVKDDIKEKVEEIKKDVKEENKEVKE